MLIFNIFCKARSSLEEQSLITKINEKNESRTG